MAVIDRPKMTVDAFVEEFNYSPWDLEETAECIVSRVRDSPLKKAAEKYLKSEEDFRSAMRNVGFELG